MTAGYSATPLAKKLGIKEGMPVLALHSPEGYDDLLKPLPPGAEVVRVDAEAAVANALSSGPLTFVHGFYRQSEILEAELVDLKSSLAKDGTMWLSWPKKAAKVETDLDGNRVRQLGLGIGLVDVKVCAVDATWSGLKFVYRTKDR